MEYINNNQKLMFICPNNHKHSISYGSWYIGSRCGLCKLTKKKTIEEVSESFKKERYKLLTTTYINSRQKLKFICPNNHKHSIFDYC